MKRLQNAAAFLRTNARCRVRRFLQAGMRVHICTAFPRFGDPQLQASKNAAGPDKTGAVFVRDEPGELFFHARFKREFFLAIGSGLIIDEDHREQLHGGKMVSLVQGGIRVLIKIGNALTDGRV